jgi:hypothetical protein
VFGNFSGLTDAAFRCKIETALLNHRADYAAEAYLTRFRSDWIEPVTLEGTRYGQSNFGQVGEHGAVLRGPGLPDSLRADAQADLIRLVEAAERGTLKSRDTRPREEVGPPGPGTGLPQTTPSSEGVSVSGDNIDELGTTLRSHVLRGGVREVTKRDADAFFEAVERVPRTGGVSSAEERWIGGGGLW